MTSCDYSTFCLITQFQSSSIQKRNFTNPYKKMGNKSYTREFKDIRIKDVTLAGGKGASLGEMTNAGIPVPPGYIVLSTTFNKFLTDAKIDNLIPQILKKIDLKNINSVDTASRKIRQLISNQPIPLEIEKQILHSFQKLNAKYVAIRSSATSEDSTETAWAGQLDSYLNITKKNILEKIKDCWASLFTSRAICYRIENNLSGRNISVAVVVQKMINSEVSGVAFSVNPVNQNPNEIIIEASYGLGEAIVSGQVTPDSYIATKNPNTIIKKNIATKTRGIYKSPKGENIWKTINKKKATTQAMSDNKIKTLLNLIQKIEKIYKFPCDIEWALEKGSIYITQSRPITTLAKNNNYIDEFSTVHKDNYSFYFHLNGVAYLSHEQMVRGFDCFDFLILSKYKDCYWFIPKSEIPAKLTEGLNLVNNSRKFQKYLKNFESLLTKINQLSFNIKHYPTNIETWILFDKLFVEFWSQYKYTEWFYTDSLYTRKKISKERIKALENIKNKARNISNEFHIVPNNPYSILLKWTCKELKCSKRELEKLNLQEILAKLKNKKNNKENSRDKGFVIWYRNHQQKEYDSNIALKLLKQLGVITDSKSVQEISGISAFKGISKGKATVIPLLYGNFKKMQKLMNEMPQGNILVASTTSPEFTPIFKKAAAIVTNEGGMGSHAAIVSREMGIPCVVGTGNATEIIKTGMIIEVDGFQGLIRILKR